MLIHIDIELNSHFEISQIVSIGDNDSDNFALSSENLSSILKKIPEGTKVAVVSVVGAFRTGKSFLLNFFLRYLRCNVSGDLSEDWMTIDGIHEFQYTYLKYK